LPMEDGINPDRKKQSRSFRWLHEVDQILMVGMKYGPIGTQEAVKRVRQLTPEVVPAQVWHRMRHLREKERGKSATPVDWSESAIEILCEGYRSGGRKKTEAIKTVRALYPGLAGYVVSRFARSQGWLDKEQADKRKGDRRPWTREEEQELFARAGYEPVKAIAEKLKRSEQSVRFRLKGRAISARVTDGWSLRRIQQTLHVSHRRLQRLIGSGLLRVRDPRVSAISLAKFCRNHGTVALPGMEEPTAAGVCNKSERFTNCVMHGPVLRFGDPYRIEPEPAHSHYWEARIGTRNCSVMSGVADESAPTGYHPAETARSEWQFGSCAQVDMVSKRTPLWRRESLSLDGRSCQTSQK
jgi:hypothetical protein